MDLSLERDSSVLGSLFNQIITDMKNTSPLWDDFIAKAGKLHACLRAAIQAISAYLDAFQKIADAATNSRGATKEIGTALTRVCLRHKAVETRLKTFTTAIMDCLVLPLQDKLEDWKRSVATIDKEHAKEHKRCRAELKKRSSDTLRLQKKARKGQSETIQSLVDSHMQDVTQRRVELEDVEKRSLRTAMIEERMRYCTFVHMLQPVVKEECEVMSEMGHLQEAMQSIALVTKEPTVLPQASEELILDAKSAISLYSESPGGSGSQGGCSNSLGSRKSSVCSISSMNSSGSSSSPGHHQYQRSLSQFVSPAIRLKPGESSDSGFCSSPALTTQASTATSQSHAISTWPPHSQDVVAAPTADRPHTISSAYEKGHQRPPLTVYTFQNPETIMESGGTSVASGGSTGSASGQTTPSTQKPSGGALSRPPLPVRCSSLERPLSANNNRNCVGALAQRQCPSPIPAHITKELSAHHNQQHQQQLQSPPTYVNMTELASMAAMKISNQQQQQQHTPPVLQQQQSTDSHSSISSIISNDSISTSQQNHNLSAAMTVTTNTPRSHSHHSHSTASSSATPSLHSHPSIDSTVATPLVGQTPTPSSGCSTPQNHYSPLLTNSPSSTTAGTPSCGSSGPGGFVFNINSPTMGQTATGNCTPSSTASGSATGVANVLKITETDSPNNVAAPCNEASTNNIDQTSSSTNNTDSPTIIENDERSRASVLQKASMFEKQAAAVSKGSPSPSPAGVVRNNSAIDNTGGSIYGLRRIEDYRAPTPVQQQMEYAAPDKDADRSFEDSIQELNNLIGELDSFQREIDETKQHQAHQGSKSSDLNEEHNERNNTTQTIKTAVTTTATLTQAATTLLTYQHQQQLNTEKHVEQHSGHSCPSSNQINSTGCGTAISDANSDEALITADKNSITSVNCIKGNEKNVCYCSSGSELGSRCYIDGVNDGDGYENPTFAHFADSRSLVTVDDGMSQTSEKLSSLHQQQAFLDNGSNENSTSAVVVIYDHQIPMTPDIDYVKKNSEIVVLRTKDPQQLNNHQQQEMRELQHLPANLSTLDGDGHAHGTPTATATATVAPANQRLSSFRASSEQQLQILSVCHNNVCQKQQQRKGGNTRIARRSSVNTAKPPPPVRRSSSVTPSQNITTAQQPPDRSTSSTSNLVYQQHHQMNNSVESLPPPPAYLLVEQSQAHFSPTSPPPPPNVIPASALKVAETVKALSALRYQPASPNALRRAQITNNNQQLPQPHHYHQQQTTTMQTHTNTYDTSFTPAPNSTVLPSTLSSEPDKDYYTPYVENNQPRVNYSPHTPPASTTHQSSSSKLTDCNKTPPYHNQQQQQHIHQEQHQVFYATSVRTTPSPPPPGISHDHATGPPPLPPPNPNRYQHNHNRHHRQNQVHHQQQQLIYSNGCQSNNINGSQSSFRTSSPGIYAQPKVVSNMSSFRTSSPSPSNGGHQLHQPQAQLPPTQPKTNPNLIAQLNARLNKQQQQQPQAIASDQTTYDHSTTSAHNEQQSETVYMRNYGTQQHVQQYQQQQHNYNAAASSTRTQQAAATASSSTQQYHQQQQQLPPHYHGPLYNREHYITCPPPLEDPPPPPPTVATNLRSATGSSATMPKNCTRSSTAATTVAIGTGLQNLATYAAATASASATLPKNLQQQRLLYQQQYHYPPDITANAISPHPQYTSNNNQRPQMPLPQQHQQQLFKHKPPPASTSSSNNYKQPPIPARHSSVQQKIYVTTNPFIQTTAIHCAPSASCSPTSAASNCSSVGASSTYTAGGAAHIHQLQQQQYHSPQHYILPGSHYGHNSISVAAVTTNTNHAASASIDKNAIGCSSMRSKTKAEFLENLNAKLSKQGISGRAFAVRNLINSKALMYQNPQKLLRPSAQYRLSAPDDEAC